jgi:hypothetical protein
VWVADADGSGSTLVGKLAGALHSQVDGDGTAFGSESHVVVIGRDVRTSVGASLEARYQRTGFRVGPTM